MRYKNLKAFDLTGTEAAQGLFGWKAEHDADELMIYAHGIVGDEYDGMDSGSLVRMIRGYKGDKITIDINTPGGFVFDGLSVYNALIDHPAHVQVDITGEAWSMGSILAMSGDTVRIGKAATFGIHEASVGIMAMVNKRELDEVYNIIRPRLDNIDEMLIEVLAERSKNTPEQIAEWMEGSGDGTEWRGQAAIDAGFADELIERKAKPAAHKFSRRHLAAKIAAARC